MSKVHGFLLDEESNIYGGYDWKDDVFIIPIQYWIDKDCENHDLPWCNLLMSKKPYPYQMGGFEACVILLLHVEYILYVDIRLLGFIGIMILPSICSISLE